MSCDECQYTIEDLFDIVFPPEMEVTAPLQMADMIANNTLEVGLDRLSKGVAELDQARIAMKENINLLGLWNEDYMLSVLKRNLVVRGRPIPLDLQPESVG